MLSKRRVKKIYKKQKSPDISYRIPALANNTDLISKRKAINCKRVAICACIAIVLIATLVIAAFYSGNYSNKEPDNTVLVDNSTSQTGGKESKENEITDDGKDHVIQNNSSEDNDSKNDVIINDSSMDDNSKDDVIYNDSSEDDNSKNDVIHNDSSKDDDSKNDVIYNDTSENDTPIEPEPHQCVLRGDNVSSGRIEEIIEVGAFQIYDPELENKLNDPIHKKCMYAVNIIVGLSDEYKDQRLITATSRNQILSDINYRIDEFCSNVGFALNGEIIKGINDFDGLVKQVGIIKTYISKLEEAGGFNEKYYDKDTTDIIYMLVNSTEEQLKANSYLIELHNALEKICKKADEVASPSWNPISVLDYKSFTEFYCETKWVYNGVEKYFKETCGVDIAALSINKAISKGYESYECYTATLTKKQIYSLKNNKYGVFVTFQGTTDGFVE